jgi:hypothetical protein
LGTGAAAQAITMQASPCLWLCTTLHCYYTRIPAPHTDTHTNPSTSTVGPLLTPCTLPAPPLLAAGYPRICMLTPCTLPALPFWCSCWQQAILGDQALLRSLVFGLQEPGQPLAADHPAAGQALGAWLRGVGDLPRLLLQVRRGVRGRTEGVSYQYHARVCVTFQGG